MTSTTDGVWPVELLRSLPTESMPSSSALQFVGGMLTRPDQASAHDGRRRPAPVQRL